MSGAPRFSSDPITSSSANTSISPQGMLSSSVAPGNDHCTGKRGEGGPILHRVNYSRLFGDGRGDSFQAQWVIRLVQ